MIGISQDVTNKQIYRLVYQRKGGSSVCWNRAIFFSLNKSANLPTCKFKNRFIWHNTRCLHGNKAIQYLWMLRLGASCIFIKETSGFFDVIGALGEY
tara:strand:- start:70 stop:360 length:291 start_codon:yes stop_codon:yes gene_type:complete